MRPWSPIWRRPVRGRIGPRALLAIVLCAASLGALAQSDVDDEQAAERAAEAARTESAVKLPPYPTQDNLLEFFVSEASDFKYFIDAKSLKVDGDIVYYTLVARSPEGVENVSYEAMRCNAREYRMFAIGHANGNWARRTTPWREMRQGSVYRWHDALRRDYFCPAGLPILTVAEGIDALRRGRHPLVDRQDGF